MELLLAISNHSDMLGGGEYSFLDLLSHLQAPWNILAVVPGEGELTAKLQKKRIETQVIPLPSIRPWFALNVLSSLGTHFNLCRRYRPGLIYANGSRAALYGGIAGRILGSPVIWHCRIADPDIRLDSLLTRLSTKIVVNSQATANRFRRHFQSKVRVVYNGVDFAWLRDNCVPRPAVIGDEWRVILVVARVSKWKRHDLALSAFEHIAKANPDCHLVCLGAKDASDPEWWDELKDRTRRSPYSNRIHWIGQVEDVRPWYRTASLLILVSENEPFGRVLVEAMACGVPVVATRTGGIPEIVRDGQDGLLVAPGRVEEIAQAMLKLLNDDALRKKMARSALEQAKIFSLAAHVAKMKEVFEDTVKK
jgi:glycosyltransferase involved in cell wall biosynthesis